MKLEVAYYILILIISLFYSAVSFEVFTAAGVAIASVLYKNTVCRLSECCTEKEIPANFAKLENLLSERLHGQHLVQDIVVNALKSHWKDKHRQKPLTLSFHGWPGGGKNYVTTFIADSLYSLGCKSSHVHFFNGRIHFPKESLQEQYQSDIYNWIKGNVTRCSRQLFVFDEVDKMPSLVLNGIKPVIDYNRNVDKVDYRDAVFIFLSNTGGSIITSQFMKLWESGKARENIELRDFEKLIMEGAFNEEGGFHNSDVIKSSLVDHYIPFLPLEEKHVRLCILDEFKLRGIDSPKSEHIQMVLDDIGWGPTPQKILSKTGCKRLSQKVGMIVQKYYIT